MIPKDKFGNPIFRDVYESMLWFGVILLRNGYRESETKPNLFYRETEEIIFFADMRGTGEVKIWEDTRPLFYMGINNRIPDWKKNRSEKDEIERLKKAGCPIRRSFYEECAADDKNENGFCKECGMDFRMGGYYCSDACMALAKRKSLMDYIKYSPSCKVCKRKIISPIRFDEAKELMGVEVVVGSQLHHTSYKDDKKIVVCRSCHVKIHHSNDPEYIQYRPEDKRQKLLEKKTVRICERCLQKSKIAIGHALCPACEEKSAPIDYGQAVRGDDARKKKTYKETKKAVEKKKRMRFFKSSIAGLYG